MADNDVVLPTDPTPPAPAPKAAVTPDVLVQDINLVLNLVRGLDGLLPADVKARVEQVVAAVDQLSKQAFLMQLLASVINKMVGSGQAATTANIQAAFFQAVYDQGHTARVSA